MNNIGITQQKICKRAELATEIARRQAQGERCVFTNGCFDLLHLGHVRYLQEARALGDLLVLGLNGDESVRQLKGAKRPLVPEAERAEILAALSCIDYVTIFPETTATTLIELFRPAIYVKGGDYAKRDKLNQKPLPEASSVLAYGGTIHLIPYVAGHSTTELIAAIKRLPEQSN
ncbi:MAG: D-glycero-beta-D-manno-heptose 1-phosphate adenylyltransferase [Ktedonobacteraceae bacterium]